MLRRDFISLFAGALIAGPRVAAAPKRTFHSSWLSLLRSRLHAYYRSQTPCCVAIL